MSRDASENRVRWNGMDGRLMPTPEWAAPGLVVFRPDGGPYDFLVPMGEIEREPVEATR